MNALSLELRKNNEIMGAIETDNQDLLTENEMLKDRIAEILIQFEELNEE